MLPFSKPFLVVLITIFTSLLSFSSAAVVLGDIIVKSSLGQRLHAHTPVSSGNQKEIIDTECVLLRAPSTSSPLPLFPGVPRFQASCRLKNLTLRRTKTDIPFWVLLANIYRSNHLHAGFEALAIEFKSYFGIQSGGQNYRQWVASLMPTTRFIKTHKTPA